MLFISFLYYTLNFLLIFGFLGLFLLPKYNRKRLLLFCLFISMIAFLISFYLFYYFYINTFLYSSFFPKKSFFFEWFFFSPLVVSLDSVSVSFILLVTFLFPFCIFYSWYTIKFKLKEFLLLLMLIELLLVQVFSVVNILYFYIVFEAILIPMFLLIGIWGSRQRKIHAAYQFFFYTAFGSFFMLIALVYIYSVVGSFDLRFVESHPFTFFEEKCLWLAFFLAFAIKVPIFPFHIWLPEAHVEAPTVGSVLLAGVLLKMGTYGLYKFVLAIFPIATIFFSPFVFLLCVLGIIYTSFSTIRQVDLKKIIAYASVGHMGYVIIGLFSLSSFGITGSLFLMLGHGIISSALFFLIGFLYDRFHTRLLPFFGGLAVCMPFFSFFLFIFTLGNMSFPGTINFIGEFLCLVGTFHTNIFVAILATSAIILTAIYSIWLFNRVCFGFLKVPFRLEKNISWDLTPHELVIIIPFVFFTFFLGIFPNVLLFPFEFPVSQLLWANYSNVDSLVYHYARGPGLFSGQEWVIIFKNPGGYFHKGNII